MPHGTSYRVHTVEQTMPRLSLPTLVTLEIAIFTLVACFSFQDGQGWDDSALYIAHAKNLATGLPYAETGYIHNPHHLVSPTSYPPVTALILAPVYYVFGMHFSAMKTVLYVFFSAALLLIFYYFRRIAQTTTAALVTTLVMYNPAMWGYKESIGSEMPFLFFLYAALLVLLLRDQATRHTLRLMWACGLGVLAYLTFATRFIGMVLIPAIVVHDLWHRRRLHTDTLPVLGTFLLGYLIQIRLLGTNADYSDGIVRTGLDNIYPNILYHVNVLSSFFPRPYKLSLVVPWAMMVLIACGMLVPIAHYFYNRQGCKKHTDKNSCKHAGNIHLFFVGAYAATLLVQPYQQGVRFLLPLLPIIIFYMSAGAMAILQLLGLSRRHSLAVMITTVSLYHSWYYMTADPPALRWGIHQPASVQMFQMVQQLVPENARVIFAKPRAMALYGQRHSAIWPETLHIETAWAYFHKIAATHLVVAHDTAGPMLQAPYFLRYDLIPPVKYLPAVFANEHFTIYTIKRFPTTAEHAEAMAWHTARQHEGVSAVQ